MVRVSGVTVDITERKRAEERQNLLAREVDHRAKNALALAQSIVRLTRGETVKAYVQAVEGRISALARVHTVLSLSSWQGAEIGKLVEEELAPYRHGRQIASDGVRNPASARDRANAGAGAARTRHQFGEIRRAVDAVRPAVAQLGNRQDVLEMIWEENDGPRVEKPVSRGFGTRSVIASIEFAARRTGRVRLARRRADLPADGSADA